MVHQMLSGERFVVQERRTSPKGAKTRGNGPLVKWSKTSASHADNSGSNPLRVTKKRVRALYNEIVGVDGDEGPPVPIPNTEVKLISVEDTWLETARENREMPTQSQNSVEKEFG